MSEQDPIWSFLIAVGSSIMGGAVAGYVLLQNPTLGAYLILLAAGAMVCFLGLWLSGAGKKKMAG